ncbi:MAG: ROK family transcriptional regulator [Ignavibacteriaceae bacterium]|jgi:predicted NBD/HSP70 family sugar kinase
MSPKSSNLITGNAKILRGINRGMILNIIREKQPISRVKIAGITGLNKSTVSSIISELLKEDLIYEEVNEDQNIGRNPLNLFLKLGKYFVGAINIDSSITRIAISDIDGSIKNIAEIETDSKVPEDFIEKCVTELLKLQKQMGIESLEGLGVTIAGIVDSEKLTVNFASNLGWENFDIGEILRKMLPGVKNISIGNDAKASALAELWFGDHAIDLSNFVFLSVGHGIGSGIVIGNKLMDSAFKAAGEFGHMVIFEGGELCKCGNNGCWEAYASDRAIVNSYIAKKPGKLDHAVDFIAQDIIDLAKQNDPTAVEILKKTGYYLGLGIANIIKAIDPYAIIIGGKVTQVWDIIYPEIMIVVTQRAYFGREKNIKILPTSLKTLPRLIGAATLAIEEIFDGYKIIA